MKYIILLSLISGTASGLDCDVHKYYCKIVETRPRVNKAWAMRLSNALYRHKAPMISIAIAMQESGLRPLKRVTHEFEDGRVAHDYGVFQINMRTAKDFGISPVRLQASLDYQVEQHLRILERKMRVCSRLGRASGYTWACYHSYTPDKYNQYKKWVGRYV